MSRISWASSGAAARRIRRIHSARERRQVPKAATKYGISVTRICEERPMEKAAIISLFSRWFMRSTLVSTSRMPMAWKSWETPSTVKA